MTSLHQSISFLGVLLAHSAVLGCLCLHGPSRHSGLAPQDEVIATAQLLSGDPQWDEAPLPDITLRAVPVNLDDLKLIQFTDSDPETLDAIEGSTSAPHLARAQTVDSAQFALRAHVLPGHPRTILLAIEVLANGATGSVSVIRGCGDPPTDAIALEYARSLRWLPGTNKRAATTMRIAFPVTLAVST